MSIETLRVTLSGREFTLDPSGAAIDPLGATGFVADLHLGKGTVFREAGIPIPTGSSRQALDALDALVRRHDLKVVWFLGDVVHAAASWTPELAQAGREWRERHPDLAVRMVPGNHDLHGGLPPADWRVEVVAEGTVHGGLRLRHSPAFDPDPTGAGDPDPGARDTGSAPLEPVPVVAGHLHPVVRLREGRRGGGGLRPRCFWWSRGTLVLPAFGPFTGGHPVRTRPGDRLFAVGPDAVVEIPVSPIP